MFNNDEVYSKNEKLKNIYEILTRIENIFDSLDILRIKQDGLSKTYGLLSRICERISKLIYFIVTITVIITICYFYIYVSLISIQI